VNYVQLYQAIQNYAETTETLFVSSIPTFVMEAEDRIYNSVQLPALRKNVYGTVTSGNQYLSLPSDYLSTFSLAVINTYAIGSVTYGDGAFSYLLNKDVNYIRGAFPKPTETGMPTHYAIFGPQYTNNNALSYILGPTPDQSYQVEMHYFYYPTTIVQGRITTFGTLTGGSLYPPGTYQNINLTGGSGADAVATLTVNSSGAVSAVTLNSGGQFYVAGDTLSAATSDLGNSGSGFSVVVSAVSNSTGTSWLGENYDPVLFYGSMREAMLFQKQEPDIIKYYDDKYTEALGQLKRLGDGLERGDAYRDGQAKIRVRT